MNEKFLSDYIILFINSQNDLLETILNHKCFSKMDILKDISKVVTKTISSSYDILSEINNKHRENNAKELEEIRKNMLKNDIIKIYDYDLKKQINKNLHYAETLESIMLHVLPDIDDSNYVVVSEMIMLFEVLNDLFEK